MPIQLITLIFAALLPVSVWAAGGASISVSVTAPASSSAAASGKSIIKSMLFSPCVNKKTIFGGGVIVSNFFDQLNIKIKGTNDDAEKDKKYDYDLYFFLVNTGSLSTAGTTTAPAISETQFYVFRRYKAFGPSGEPQKLYGVDISLRRDTGVEPPTSATAPDMLLRGKDMNSATIDETILGGDIGFDGYELPQGTWLAVAILAEADVPLSLNEPKTWAAWDAVPFILGTPWKTTTNKTCS